MRGFDYCPSAPTRPHQASGQRSGRSVGGCDGATVMRPVVRSMMMFLGLAPDRPS
jgi:hypothetical protein